MTSQPDTLEDNCFSAASVQVRSIPPLSTQVLPTCPSTQVNPLGSSGVTTLLQTSSLPQPTLPPIPTSIQKKIARGEYIDFTAQAHVWNTRVPVPDPHTPIKLIRGQLLH